MAALAVLVGPEPGAAGGRSLRRLGGRAFADLGDPWRGDSERGCDLLAGVALVAGFCDRLAAVACGRIGKS